MNGIDEFKKMCLEVEKKSNKLKADINTFIAKYQSLGDCPLEELDKMKKRISEQSEWINDINIAYEIAKKEIIDSIKCEFMKEYATKQMDCLSSFNRLAALELGDKILNVDKNTSK